MHSWLEQYWKHNDVLSTAEQGHLSNSLQLPPKEGRLQLGKNFKGQPSPSDRRRGYTLLYDVLLSNKTNKTVGKEEQRVLWYWSFEAILHDLSPNFQGDGQTSAWQWEVVNNSSFLLYFHVQLFLFWLNCLCLR